MGVRSESKAGRADFLTWAPKWQAREPDGWEMASIAAFVLGAQGVYRTPDDTGLIFVIMTAVGWAT
jgi:hypothetical protein